MNQHNGVRSPDPQERLAALRTEARQLEWRSDPRDLRTWLVALNETCDELGASDDSLAALLAASNRPDDAQTLFVAGYHLVELGMYDHAVPLLTAADIARPGHLPTTEELVYTLNQAGRYDLARALVADREQWFAHPASLCVQRIVAAIGLADLADVERQTASLVDPGFAQARTSYEALLGRAGALRRNGFPLDTGDLTGWHAALTAGIVLRLSGPDVEGMNGRFAAMWLSKAEFAAVLDSLVGLVASTQRRFAAVCCGPTRDDEIVARAVAHRLGIGFSGTDPLIGGPPAPDPVLHVVWAWKPGREVSRQLLDPAGQAQRASVAIWTDWTAIGPVGPDVTGLLAQTVFAPWAELMRVHPDPAAPNGFGNVERVPADRRPADEIAGDAAQWVAAGGPGASIAAPIDRLVAALSEVPDLVGWWGGRREATTTVHPVRSSRFT